MSELNLTAPKCWASLNQKQLLHIFTCIAAGYSAEQVQATALMRWNNLSVLEDTGKHTYLIQQGRKEYLVSSLQVAAVLHQLDYLSGIPEVPVRLEKMKGRKALPADFQGVPFEKFIMCDNLYQGYLHTQNSERISDLAGILYDFREPVTLTKAQEVSVFYWWTSLKRHFGNMFPNFLKLSPAEDEMALCGSLYRRLSESMNAQIRALTKGDITKEKEVLQMDTWRALTELDAQAREYDDMQKAYKK